MKRLAMLFGLFVLVGLGCNKAVVTDVDTTDEEEREKIEVESDAVIEVEVVEGLPINTNPDQEDEEAVLQIEINSENYSFTPSFMTASPGQELKIVFSQNSGVHTFVIDEIGLNVPINEGDSTTFIAPSEPGTYSYYCSIGNHRALGMEGVLIVQ